VKTSNLMKTAWYVKLDIVLVMANIPSSPILVTLMKEALGYSETSVLTRATRRNIPEDIILHGHCREILKTYTLLTLFPAHRLLSSWWWRPYVLPKRRFLQEPHGVTSQKTPFFIVTTVKTSILTAPQLSSKDQVNPVADLLLWKSGSVRNRTRDLWVCSQELWPLDHRAGQ
jgi:hypothetical protein